MTRLCLTTQPLALRPSEAVAGKEGEAGDAQFARAFGARRGIVDQAARRTEGDKSKRQRTPQPVDARRGCQTEPRATLKRAAGESRPSSPGGGAAARRLLAVGVFLWAATAVPVGCAGPPGTAHLKGGKSAERTLTRLAEAESRRVRRPRRLVAVPPGVEPQVLMRLKGTPEMSGRGDLELSEALLAVSWAYSDAPPPPQGAGAVTTEARTQALRHYVRGRDAAARNRHFVSINELGKALKLDPGSPAILRQLARSYLAMGNTLNAASFYKRLLRVEPADSEALFSLGLDAFNRRRFQQAAAYLARPRLKEDSFRHDPAAGALADFYLASAIRRLGYERASIELNRRLLESLPDPLGTPTMYAERLQALYLRRGEIWRSIGDAHCRLGEYERALDVYRYAAPLAADRDALRPRVLYANLCLGRVYSAQRALLDALDEGSPVDEADIRLFGYLADHVDERSLLAEAVVKRSRNRPGEPGLARAAAMLLERDAAVELLQSILDRRSDDMETFAQLVGWLASHDGDSAVALTVALTEGHPERSGRYARRLALAAPDPGELLHAAADLPPTPAGTAVKSRLIAYVGGFGRAWDVAEQGLGRWPGTPLLVRLQIELAGALGEPELLARASAAAPDDDVLVWLARSQAHLALGETESSVATATRGIAIAPDNAELSIAKARAHAAHAATRTVPDERRQHADDAVAAARKAIELDPKALDAYAVLLGLYGPGGLISDRGEFVEVRQELERTSPGSRLGRRLEARGHLRQQRYERSLEVSVSLCDDDPGDTESLALAVAAWVALDRPEAARQWLTERLNDRPADPELLAEWVAIKQRLNQQEAAVTRLEEVLVAIPAHDWVRRLLQQLYLGAGQLDKALRVAEERLLSRPRAVGRELELAVMYAQCGRREAAHERLRWILGWWETAGFKHLVGAMAEAGRLRDTDAGDDTLALAFAERIVERFPDSPLQIYGTGLRALARMGQLGRRFDEFAARAVANARGAVGSTPQAAEVWRQLAQALVDAGHPAAAARALRARLLADQPLEPTALELLSWVALVADAAADRAVDSIQLIRTLDGRGQFPQVPGAGAPLALPERYFRLSNIYSLLGSHSGARQLLKETLALNAEHPMALNNLGYTLIEAGVSDAQTRAWIEKAYELNPGDANVLDTIGWLNYKRGRFRGDAENPGAMRLIEQSLARGGATSPEVLDHLGDTRWRTGDAPGAAEAWRRAVEILQDARRREGEQQDYMRIQVRGWGLLVADPAQLYERRNAPVLRRVRSKLREMAEGRRPAVAWTFAELDTPDSARGTDDGRP